MILGSQQFADHPGLRGNPVTLQDAGLFGGDLRIWLDRISRCRVLFLLEQPAAHFKQNKTRRNNNARLHDALHRNDYPVPALRFSRGNENSRPHKQAR